MTYKQKQINLIIAILVILGIVAVLYPTANHFVIKLRNHNYLYSYDSPKNLKIEDLSSLKPAQEVPILMYHGVRVKGNLGENTEREIFIKQMEMLKQKGYETISINDFDLFRQGKFILPKKPIIITFDDGRKDSFYTVDEILKKLGFKAVLFVATGKPEVDPFFLDWKELQKVKDTGRWEIEAHGRHSHENIPIDNNGATGKYLTSRMYIKDKGLETVDQYKNRVEQDYIDSINDLREHLGIESHYFAVPLNDYGDFSVTNYSDSYNFNQKITDKYFKLAFVQAEQNDTGVIESFYNFKDSKFDNILRLEVKNMSAEKLIYWLDRFSFKKIDLHFERGGDVNSLLSNGELLYGDIKKDNNIFTLLSNTKYPSSRMLFGSTGWMNYKVEATIERLSGKSASLIVYYTNENNYIELDWSEKSISLNEYKAGVKRKLGEYYPYTKKGEVKIIISVYNGNVNALFDGIVLSKNISTVLSRGAAGFSVWDPNGASSSIKEIKITSISK